MASTKMFVHYSGTVADFKKLSNISDYQNKIVFIKGGADGKGAAIYTHGSYFANFAEFLAAVNFVKGVNVGGQNYNAAQGGGYLAFNASDPATVAVNAGQNGISIGLTKDFVDRVSAVETLAGNTSADLGAKGAAADANGSAFARIAKLANDLAALTGSGSGSVSDQIAALKEAIEGDLSDSSDAKTLAAINDELNLIDAKWASYVSKDELSKIGDTKDHGTDVNVSVTTLGGKVTGVVVNETGLTNKLNGKANVGDSYLKSETYTKTEVTAEAARLIKILEEGAVKNNADAISILQGDDKTKSIREVAIEELAKIINDDNNDDAVNTLEEIAAWIAAHPESVAAINKQITDLGKLVGTTSVESQINTKISGLNKTDSAVAGEYVSAVSETAGVITVTRVPLPTYTLVEGTTNGTVKFNNTEVKVHGLGSAAYTNANAYATAAQGAKADTAVQTVVSGSANGTIAVDGSDVAVTGLKSAAFTDASAYDAAGAAAAVLGTDADDAAATTVYGAKAYADLLFAWEEL